MTGSSTAVHQNQLKGRTLNTHAEGDFLPYLYQLSVDLLNQRQPDQVAQMLVDEVARLLRSPFTEVMLYREERLVVMAYTDREPFIKGDIIERADGRLAWQAFDTRKPAVLENYSAWEFRRPIYESSHLYAVADVPMIVGDQCVGILAIGRDTPNDPFTDDEIQKSIILSQLAGAAITNASLYADALREIEQRKQVEEALRRSELQFRVMTDNMREMVAYIDIDGRIAYASPSYYNGLGYLPEEMIGQYALDYIFPEDHNLLSQLFQGAVFHHTAAKLIEFRCLHKAGYALWMEASGTMMRDYRGDMIGVLLVLRDIHERHELGKLRLESDRLAVTLQKEQELSRLKSHMMARIGHEFRTPLANIQVTADMVIRYHDRMTVEQRETRLRSITPQVQQITNMLDSINAVVNPPRVMDIIPVPLGELCDQLVHELRDALSHRGPVEVRITPHSLSVNADRKLLLRMLHHILLNAIEFSPSSAPIMVTIFEHEYHVTIEVHDFGIGIPADDQPRVFEPFFRGSNIGEVSGLGVGLSIARATAEAHGGTIQVESSLNQGTHVTIRLPKVPPQETSEFAIIQ
ncbi:MAG: ATP-binding protein [Anaerolineae bacterium]